jgi:hypothetical protein
VHRNARTGEGATDALRELDPGVSSMVSLARTALPALLLAGALGACQTASAPPAPPPALAAPGVTPSTFRMPEGAGCTGEVARYRAVMDNDLAAGHTTRAVHGRVTGEIDGAAAACAAGRDAEAVRMIAATKSRYGYR